MIYALLAGAESPRREIGPAVWRGPEHSTSLLPPQSQDTRAVCQWGKMREKIGGEKELVAPALANPVDPVLVSPPAVKCVQCWSTYRTGLCAVL
jgi:hypothetical protein